MKEPYVPYCTYLTPTHLSYLRMLAQMKHESQTSLVRAALDDYLRKHARELSAHIHALRIARNAAAVDDRSGRV